MRMQSKILVSYLALSILVACLMYVIIIESTSIREFSKSYETTIAKITETRCWSHGEIVYAYQVKGGKYVSKTDDESCSKMKSGDSVKIFFTKKTL